MDKPKTKMLYITKYRYCGAIVFIKVDDRWLVSDMAPMFRPILRGVKVEDMGKVLTERGYEYQWV